VSENGHVRRRFCLVLVKPSHYDDDGYVIQWYRSAIPSNSLAALYGLARDCAERRCLGEDTDIEVHAWDETNTRIRPKRIAKLIEGADAGMVALVGVQSNQFPRAPISHGPCAGRAFRSGSVASTYPAPSPCWPSAIRTCGAPRRWGSRCSRERPRGGSMRCCAMLPPGSSSRSTISWTTCRGSKARRHQCFRPNGSSAPQAPTPASTPAAAVPINAHFVRSSTSRVANRVAARLTNRADRARQRGPGHQTFLHHRR